jgi:hypothetical protein
MPCITKDYLHIKQIRTPPRSANLTVGSQYLPSAGRGSTASAPDEMAGRHAARRRLRRTGRDQMTVGDSLLLDRRHPGIEVDAGPARSGGFTAAQAAQGDQPPHHREAIVRDEAEEGRGLFGGPHGNGRSLSGGSP